MKLYNILFPELKGTWAEFNLNELAKTYGSALDAEQQSLLLNKIHNKLNIDYSYGGWQEDRSILWKGHYMALDKMIHLGIDYNVPAGTKIHFPFDCDVVFKIHDKDQNGGWGGRIDFKSKTLPFYFILGHLSEKDFVIGKSSENGGWFPHLHVQAVTKAEYERHSNPMDIDGYGGTDSESNYPNPELVLKDYK